MLVSRLSRVSRHSLRPSSSRFVLTVRLTKVGVKYSTCRTEQVQKIILFIGVCEALKERIEEQSTYNGVMREEVGCKESEPCFFDSHTSTVDIQEINLIVS